MTTISIALCTYNGAAYLTEQLDSIAAQTRLPDELIVCDDGSGDATVEILQEFAARALFPVEIIVNETNIGSTKNFERAIAGCDGDIIALADQDDVWRPEKLARLETALADAPGAGFVFTDADIVDKTLTPLGYRLWQCAAFGPREQQRMARGHAFEMLRAQNVVTGATMAFRAAYKPVALPIPDGVPLIHDGWLALIISALANPVFIAEPLISYRQHPQQQMGIVPPDRQECAVKVLPAGHYESHRAQTQILIERLESRRQTYPGPVLERRLAELRAQSRHLERRLSLPRARWRRLPVVLGELLSGRYHRHSNGFPSVARDLFFPAPAQT